MTLIQTYILYLASSADKPCAMSQGRPNGGWGWCVVMSGFLVSFLIDGVKYSFGMMFIELMDAFKGSKGQTSLIMSIQVGAMLLAGKSSSFMMMMIHVHVVVFYHFGS